MRLDTKDIVTVINKALNDPHVESTIYSKRYYTFILAANLLQTSLVYIKMLEKTPRIVSKKYIGSNKK